MATFVDVQYCIYADIHSGWVKKVLIYDDVIQEWSFLQVHYKEHGIWDHIVPEEGDNEGKIDSYECKV